MLELTKWKRILKQDLLELQQQEHQRLLSRIRYDLKLQEIGHHCWQASEHLTDVQLRFLREALACSLEQWHVYRKYVSPYPQDPNQWDEPSDFFE